MESNNLPPEDLRNSLTPFFAKIDGFIDYVYTEVMRLAPWFVVISIIIAGYLYMTGNREAGKKALVAAVVGIVIIVLSAVMVMVLNSELSSA